MISKDFDMLFMLVLLSIEAVAQDFCISLQVIKYLNIDVGIKFESDIIHHSISNIVDLVKDDFYTLFRKLSAFKDLS